MEALRRRLARLALTTVSLGLTAGLAFALPRAGTAAAAASPSIPPPSSDPAPAYGVIVEARCVDQTPVVDVTSTSPGDVRVAVGPDSQTLTAGIPFWQASWPSTDGVPDSEAKWDAVRLDVDPPVIFDSGKLTLPADCPPAPIVPSAPEEVTAEPGNGTVTLSWLPPVSDGGSKIIDYVVEQSPDGITGWTTIDEGVGTGPTAVITGLANGTLYYFRVLAVNEIGGAGPASLGVKVTPRTVPDAPLSLTAAPTGVSGQIHLTWAAPPWDGGWEITDYVIEQSLTGTSGASDWTKVADGTDTAISFTVTGLANGTRYYFRVSAVNDMGSGGAGNVANAIPRTVPTAPRSLTAAPTNQSGRVRLAWVAPSSNGGAAVTDYVVQRSPNGTSSWSTISDGVSTATTYTVTGLTNGTRYYFRVSAVNAALLSPASNVANAAPRTVPTAPRSLTAAPTNQSGRVRLAWVAPSSNGGAAVTDYVVQRSPNGTSSWSTISDGVSTAMTYTVTGLTNGTRYYFRVSAVNAAGLSPASNVANAIARTVPTVPRSLIATATGASGQLRLAWLAPSSNGGSAITDYVIHRSLNGTSGWTLVSDGVGTATAFTVTGLANRTRYYFRVFARNAAGFSVASGVASAVPVYILTPPRSLTATPGNHSVRLSWVAPLSDGGSAIRDYILQRSPNGSTGWVTIPDGVSTATSYTVGGLYNGVRYYFRAFARTANATSWSSIRVSAIPRTVPTAPRSLVATATGTSGQVRLSWLAPSSNGGSAITDYLIHRSLNGTNWTAVNDGVSTNAAYTVTGLANGTRYYFRVFARNTAGSSGASGVVRATPRALAN